MSRLSSLLLAGSLAGVLGGCAARPPPPGPAPSAALSAVLRERQVMNAREMSDLPLYQAREAPWLIDAARAMQNARGLPAMYTDVRRVNVPLVDGRMYGPLSARLFRPAEARDTPVILYFPGGTWATGPRENYDATPRELAARTGWVVLSLQTRQAPEAQFPGIHDDAFALYQWARAHLREWGADPTRVVLAGEGPGANLALSTALLARERTAAGMPTPLPDQLLLITPLAGTALNTPSMAENRRGRPLSRATVDWAQDLYAPGSLRDPRIDLAAREDFAGLPPTTVVLAQIDPLRSGGEVLAAKLSAAGVRTEARVFPGATYDFFGLGRRTPESTAAEDYAVGRMKGVFRQPRAARARAPGS